MIIYFEGLCGVGKTTLIEEYAKSRKNVKIIPQFIAEPDNLFDDVACMKNDELKSKLAYDNKEKIVLMDRGYLSTLVYGLVRYQVTDKHESFDHISEWLLTNLNSKLIRPDIYIWVDTPNNVCMRRVYNDNRMLPDSYWYKDLDAVRTYYKKLFKSLESTVPLFKLNGELELSSNINLLDKIIYENSINKR